jgi:hypothetical protein
MVLFFNDRCNGDSVGEPCASVGQHFQRCVGKTKPTPGLEQPWVSVLTNCCNAVSVGDSAASVGQRFQRCVDKTKPTPGLSLSSNPGLKLANAFGVIQTDALPKAFGVIQTDALPELALLSKSARQRLTLRQSLQT